MPNETSQPSETSQPVEYEDAHAKGATRKPSILLVDDVEANLIALEALLGDMDCELIRAKSGNDALRQLLKRDFALMLLDVQMPDMDGYEVARYSRENISTRDVPIIFITAMHETDETTLQGYGTGAVDLLFKPINSYVLRAKVRIFLELYNSRKDLAKQVEVHEKTLTELQHTNAALRHFTDAASHDLKAPLRAIDGFLVALSEEASGKLSAQAMHYLTRSREAGIRMSSILDSLLAYARLKKPVSFGAVDCEKLVQQVTIDLADRLRATNATLHVKELPVVRGDAARIYQLLVNLVGNALKFHRPNEPARVTISAQERDHKFVFCVEDNGLGIDAADQTRIFEAFRRLHRTASYEGSGLGLTICQQIVQQHSGEIWAESAPGQGSRFFFTLPPLAEAL